MSETPVRAVEMVRVIRDKIYEQTKDLSREELKEFYRREAAALREQRQEARLGARSGRRSEADQPPIPPGARPRR